jgi:hypothetical protein
LLGDFSSLAKDGHRPGQRPDNVLVPRGLTLHVDKQPRAFFDGNGNLVNNETVVTVDDLSNLNIEVMMT